MKHANHIFLFSCFLILFGFLENARAVPGFSRQTGLDCMMCHAQSQTQLNGFGRNFARTAYSMSTEDGSQSLIVGEELKLGMPMTLNMSLMLKARYDKSYNEVNGKGKIVYTADGDLVESNRGIYEIFKTSTINLAGKVADNVGTLIEVREKQGKAIIGAKAIASFETGEGYSGLSIFSTDTYGPFTGMETYNTGLYKPLRQFENHKLTNAAQAADLGTGAATGLQLFYAGQNIFATFGAYVPVHNPDGIDIRASMIMFSRLAYEQPLGDLTLILGAYGISGKTKASNTSFDPSISGYIPRALVEIKKEAYGLDLQLEGTMLDMYTQLTMNAVLKNKTSLDNPYLMGDPIIDVLGEPEDAHTKAYSISFELYPVSSLGLKFSYLELDDKGLHIFEPDKIDVKDKRAFTLGFDYSFRQNVKFTMEYSMVRPTKENIADYGDILSVLTISF
ncbi:hypothetical protein KJ877_05800 [bacterium]|nr:hypothetical protein [bacterium]MBU1989697.1 hypothetical protein [bacterium]